METKDAVTQAKELLERIKKDGKEECIDFNAARFNCTTNPNMDYFKKHGRLETEVKIIRG